MLLSVFSLFAQRLSAQEDTPLFRSGVANVRIDVQVTEGNDLVTDLTKEDFIVTDQYDKQPIVYFGRESEPLSLILLLDVSGSMRKYIEQVAEVARESLRFMRPHDRVAVMVFAKNSKVRLDYSDSISAVIDEIKEAVTDETLEAGTDINGALLEAARYTDKNAGEKGRRAVLILTDNLGLNYKSPDEPVIEEYMWANTVLNAIVVGRGDRPLPPREGVYRNPDFTPPDVFKISEQTGGEAVKADQAGRAFNRMIDRIRTRYSIHYKKPEAAFAGFRRVEVQLTPEARARYPKAEVKHRRGYRVK